MKDFRTRFAPSPTGPLHLGHAYSAILAHDMARAAGGTFLLRIEDIDQARARSEWEALIEEDLRWLGLSWDGVVLRQSDRMGAYAGALDQLWRQRLLYPCTCTRRDIAESLAAPQEGVPAVGPDGPVYPGTCRDKVVHDGAIPGPRPGEHALRLDMARAIAFLRGNRPASEVPDDREGGIAGGFTETGAGPGGETGMIAFTNDEMLHTVGDIVVARRDMGTSYHLSVVVDDATQAITHVVRGADLFAATKIHVLLQRLLGLPTPAYHHHRLIRDDAGKRLAKRDDARAIRKYRDEGATPADIRRMVGF